MNAWLDCSSRPRPGDGLAGPVGRWWLAAAGTAVALLYLAGVVNAWWPTPDSALYHGLGRNLMSGRGYVFNGRPYTTVTPGLPVLLGLTEHLAGGDAFWVKNLIICLTGLASLVLAYATLRRMVRPRLAFAAVLASALCYVYYDHSHLILTDAPFALLFWAVAYSARRMLTGSWAWAAAVAALSAVAIMIRLPGLTLLGPLAVAVAVDKPPPSAGARGGAGRRVVGGGVILIAIVAMAVGVCAVCRCLSGKPSPYVTSHLVNLGRGLGVHVWQLAPVLLKLPETTGQLFTGLQGYWIMLLGYPLLAVIVAGMTSLWRRGVRTPAIVLVLSALALILGAGVNASKARYFMPLEPLIALGLIEGVVVTLEWIRRRRGLATVPLAKARAVVIAVAVIGAANSPWLLRSACYYSYQGHHGRYLDVIEHGKYADLYATADYISKNVAPGEKVHVRKDRVRMLHLLSGKVIDALYSFGVDDPWNAAQADVVYRDLLARPEIDVVIDDPGALDARYAERMTELLDTTGGLRMTRQIGKTRIYRRAGVLTPSTRPTSQTPETGAP